MTPPSQDYLAESAPIYFVGTVVSKLERLRQERQQVSVLLKNAKLLPETRRVLQALALDLEHEIDQELTRFLNGESSDESYAAD